MLTSLYIRNMAIISDMQVPLASGFTVVTGETGAGKSIVLGALGFCAGHRADSTMVGMREQKAEVIAELDLKNEPMIRDWLDATGLDNSETCIIRREISHDGRSRAFINDRPVTVQTLKNLGHQVFEFHGQHEHQRLLKPDVQLDLLDDFCQHQEQIAELTLIFKQIRLAKEEIDRLSRQSGEHSYQAELLKYQIQELEGIAIDTEAFIELEKEQQRLASADTMIRTGHAAVEVLDGERGASVTGSLAQLSSSLAPFSELDKYISEACDLVSDALANVTEASSALRRFTEHAEIDPERQQLVEKQLSELVELSRKHRIRPEDLNEHLNTLKSELALLDNDQTQLNNLEKQLKVLETEYTNKAKLIHNTRQKNASKLAKLVTESLKSMGMEKARFEVILSESNQQSSNGIDKLEMHLQANPGQAEHPLQKVASGGELSRISLAIKVACKSSQQVPVMIFDEVDAGIGGPTAIKVARLLRTLSDQRQVLCVTHVPQVCASGHNHLHVSKTHHNNETDVTAEYLLEESRVDELARMLGGDIITEQTRALSRQLIDGNP
ncbi:MAG: DNA repair protein RecN [bacterium]